MNPTIPTLLSSSFLALGLGLSMTLSACDPGEEFEGEDIEAFADEDETELDDAVSQELASLPPEGNDDMPPPAEDREQGELPLTADDDPSGYAWTGPWFSDETTPSGCGTGALVTGTQCSGSYCDNRQIECHAIPNRTLAGRIWSGWISGSSWYTCPGDRFISAMACRGDNCDDIAVECTSTYYVPPVHTCTWSGWFSEEDAPFYAPVGTALRGVQCSGTHCDDTRYYYCTI